MSAFVLKITTPTSARQMILGCLLSVLFFSPSQALSETTTPPVGESSKRTKRVTLLPFIAGEGVKQIQADGFHALLKEQFANFDSLQVRPARKDDQKTSTTCQQDAACLHEAAVARQVDLLGAGYVTRVDGGFKLALTVVNETEPSFKRRVSEDLLGDKENIFASLDRLLRSAFAPHTLAGAIMVRGTPIGAHVYIDGVRRGTIPLDAPILGIVEGRHNVEVRKDGYFPLTQPVDVYFKELTQIEIDLSTKRKDLEPNQESEETSSSLHYFGAAGLLGLGATSGAGAGVAAISAFMLARVVEERASQQQLFLPEDALFFQLGTALQWAAYGLFALSVPFVTLGSGWTGFALFFMDQAPEEETMNEAAPLEDVPDLDDIEPSLTQVNP